MSRGTVNKMTLIGTLGRDVEMRYLPNGNAVCSLSIATDEGYKDRNTGQQVEKTEWHRVEAFGRLAEIMGEYLKKGSKVYIEGKLRTDEYEKDGIKRYATKIIANEMTMLDTRSSNDNMSGGQVPQPAAPAHGQAPQQQAPQQQARQQAAPAYGQAPQQQAPQQAAPAYGQAPQQQAPQQAAPTYGQAPQQQPTNQFSAGGYDNDIPFAMVSNYYIS